MNLRHVRRLIHERYTRAVIAGVALTVAICSVGVATVEVQHGVSLQAVVRFFSRSHLRQADLSSLVHDPETVRQLQALSLPELGVDPGGLVYANGSGLSFHLYLPERAQSTRQRHQENSQLYPQLVRHYFASDLEALLGVLNSSQATARLSDDGVEWTGTLDMSGRSLATLESFERSRRLRRAAQYIHRFAPFYKEPYELSFAEKLKFYELQRPQGRFVGAFEIHGLGPSSVFDISYAHAVSRNKHYLVIQRIGPGQFKLKDFYKGQERRYTIGFNPDPTRA